MSNFNFKLKLMFGKTILKLNRWYYPQRTSDKTFNTILSFFKKKVAYKFIGLSLGISCLLPVVYKSRHSFNEFLLSLVFVTIMFFIHLKMVRMVPIFCEKFLRLSYRKIKNFKFKFFKIIMLFFCSFWFICVEFVVVKKIATEQNIIKFFDYSVDVTGRTFLMKYIMSFVLLYFEAVIIIFLMSVVYIVLGFLVERLESSQQPIRPKPPGLIKASKPDLIIEHSSNKEEKELEKLLK